MAQFMVFFNGLILTVTAFFTLSIFIHEMQRETADEKFSLVFSTFESGLSKIEHAFTTASFFVQQQDKEDLTFIRSNIQDISHFSGLFLIEASNGRNFRYVERLGSFPATFNLQQDLQGLNTSNTGGPTKIAFHVGPEKSRSDNFIVFRKKLEVKGRGLLFYGFVPLHTYATIIRQEYRSVLQSIEVFDNEGDPILNLAAAQGEEDRIDTSPSSLSRKERTFMMAGTPITIVLTLLKDQRASFLDKIPLLMLLFGFTLTLVGTLYVRNNQKQSNKLAEMNRVLATKNMELNNQIGERERLNARIQKAEKENRTILNAVSEIMFELNDRFEIRFLNAAWEKITGFTVKESLGKNLIELFHAQDQLEQREYFALLLSGKEKTKRTYVRLKTTQGEYRSVEIAVSMVRKDENGILRIIGTITDVEERRRAERALSEAEKKYRTIVENAAGGIYQISPEGRLLSANPALAKILGFNNPKELLAGVYDINREVYKDHELRQQFLDKVKRSEDVVYQEVMAVRHDAKEIWIAENSRAVRDEEGRLMYFEGSIEDISERKQTEKELKEEKLKSDLANRTKSEFLAHMSHELRTPLNSIIGFSEIIKNQVFGPIGQEAYWEYARDIHDSGRSLLAVINNILDMARIEVGERQLNESLVDLQKIIPVCVQLMSPKMEAKKLSVNFDSQKVYPKLIGEELAIKQMLMSLFSNAIKFSSDGNVVTINGDINSAGEFMLSITDTGIGMDDDEIEKALAPFSQISSTVDGTGAGWNGSGMGLGLTLTDSLIKLHGGRLELVSKKGVGTTATIVFPAKRVARQAEAKKPSEDKLSELVSQDYVKKDDNEEAPPPKTIH
jgi:PAS domain S-box-containing protein